MASGIAEFRLNGVFLDKIHVTFTIEESRPEHHATLDPLECLYMKRNGSNSHMSRRPMVEYLDVGVFLVWKNELGYEIARFRASPLFPCSKCRSFGFPVRVHAKCEYSTNLCAVCVVDAPGDVQILTESGELQEHSNLMVVSEVMDR